MKVAILTQPLHTNYGGTLQAFALQYILKQLGCDPLTINYRKTRPYVNPIKSILSQVKQKVLNGKVIFPYTEKDLSIISRHHNDFINEYIKYSNPIYGLDDLKTLVSAEHFETVIVGSDQTWRPRYSPRIDSFFLDFLSGNSKINKVSYASSFGTDDWEFTAEQTMRFSNLVKEFNYISVREGSAVSLCSEYFGVSSSHVLDPTLLLDRVVYLELLNKSAPIQKGRVFNYVLDKSEDKKNIINKVCDYLGKESFSTYPKHMTKEVRCIKDYSNYIYPSIEAWIRSFHDADFIITDSFHGTVFSIIFNKPFISIANETRGKARFTSLLKMFDLEHRLVSHTDEIKSDLVLENIDYDVVNSKLDALRESSIFFLKKSLSL